MKMQKGVAYILFGILTELTAICLLIADPWIPIIDDVRFIVYVLVLTGFVTGVIGLVSIPGQDR